MPRVFGGASGFGFRLKQVQNSLKGLGPWLLMGATV